MYVYTLCIQHFGVISNTVQCSYILAHFSNSINTFEYELTQEIKNLEWAEIQNDDNRVKE